jgi:surface polysaccharide O-acyltransferase-like enzyme
LILKWWAVTAQLDGIPKLLSAFKTGFEKFYYFHHLIMKNTIKCRYNLQQNVVHKSCTVACGVISASLLAELTLKQPSSNWKCPNNIQRIT